jgi:hypothetical protein
MTDKPLSRNCEGVIYSPADQCWFLAEGKGLTTNRAEAHVYTRQSFDYMYGPHTKLEFQPIVQSETPRLSPPTEEEIAAYRNLFRAELDKNMNNSSASPSTDAHRVALHKFVEGRNVQR